jgi:hypothetical protein
VVLDDRADVSEVPADGHAERRLGQSRTSQRSEALLDQSGVAQAFDRGSLCWAGDVAVRRSSRRVLKMR